MADVDRIFAKSTISTPGCAVGAAVDGQHVLNRAYGMADLERNVKNTADTIFEAGSVAKQFTAAALLLVREGKVLLDDPARKYIPELPDYGSPLTVRHMWNHTSGLRDWGSVEGIAGWPRTSRVYTHAHVLEIVGRQHSLNFEPGTVGDAAFVAEQQQPGQFKDGCTHSYAFGLGIGTYKGVRQVDHGGSTAGYRAYLARYPDQHVYGGMPAYHNCVLATPSTPWSFERFAAETFEQGLCLEPGEGWKYSNPGYMLVRRIAEEIAGESFRGLIAERIARPLGLQRTFVAESLEDLASLAPGMSWILSTDGLRG